MVAIHRSPGLRQCASLVKRQRKRPGTFRIPGLCEQRSEGARLGAPFSRIQRTLAPIKAIARRNGPVHRHRCEQRDERNQPLQGSVGPNDVVRFHGEILWFWLWLRRAGFSMGANCKDSLPDSSTPCENGVRLRCIAYTPVSNITLTRRQNALALFQDYAEKALSSGAAPKGLEQSFAASLQISPSMWSQIKSSRPIGDKLARQIESACGKSSGWLDELRKDAAPTAAETAYLELALAAWRSTNSAGRKALREHLKAIVANDT